MDDKNKTKKQLIHELVELRKVHNELEKQIKKRNTVLQRSSEVLKRKIEECRLEEQSLRIAEKEKNVILDSITEHVLYHDTDLKILWSNRAAAEAVGLTPKQLIGCYCYKIGFNRDTPCEGCPVAKAVETGKSEMGEVTTSDGRIWFMRGYPVRNVSGEITGAVEIALDVTVLKNAEEALRMSEEKYRKLTENINVGIYRNTVGASGKFVEANKAITKIFDYNSREEFLAVDVNGLYQSPEDRKRFNEKMLKQGFVREEEIRFKKRNGEQFYGSVSAVAIKDENGNVKYYDGIIEDITERKKAEKKLKESYEKLQRILNGTVNALVSTTEKRDEYTAGHQQRVAQLACAIAEEMNLSENMIAGIRVAGIVHDIGKIYVAVDILNKPVQLEDIEMSLIKSHCQAGYEILKTVEFPWPVADIVLQHHERIDGSGYPRGLSGKDIMLEARILTVADVVEAMISHRPYRSALSTSEVFEEITKNRGGLYDDEVVDACLRIFEKGFTFK